MRFDRVKQRTDFPERQLIVRTLRPFMKDAEKSDENFRAIYVDVGTTNTRGWLVSGDVTLAHARKSVGVRDTARDRAPAKLQSALKELISELQNKSNGLATSVPCCVVAAGMISSPLGLAEVPHVPAPVSVEGIAAASRAFHFPEITSLPILLVPGVRWGPSDAGLDSLDNVDVMRGEETLCFGLLRRGLLRPPGVVINLGSHWKAIQVDSEGRIECSITSLSGELIHAAQTQTILASSVSADLPGKLAPQWIEAGMTEQRRSGLPRALFSVRLLELANRGTPAERFSFLVGAFISSDFDGLVAKGMLSDNTSVVISGNVAIAEAWRHVLARLSIRVVVLSADETERALLAGLKCILVHSLERVK